MTTGFTGFEGRIAFMNDLIKNGDKPAFLPFGMYVDDRVMVDGEWTTISTRINCTANGYMAERIADNFEKGDLVTVMGELGLKKGWVDKEGNEHEPSFNLRVSKAGHSIWFGSVDVDRTKRSGSGSGTAKRTGQDNYSAPKAETKPKVEESSDSGDDWF